MTPLTRNSASHFQQPLAVPFPEVAIHQLALVLDLAPIIQFPRCHTMIATSV
eukprot:CAMPEP_0177648560 /NCGR_PEP_ID=MMETSP0447-20121125/10893_1 /TAXON_ID=0 /ORGANISM="Stygamoeba regulata, Strain BSH-02190019" /LENGTH=51 /DNA_ID=CAMNT_0019151209 /DNA_START=77 /DNA_END=232 /DNA_ORIENTATION=+